MDVEEPSFIYIPKTLSRRNTRAMQQVVFTRKHRNPSTRRGQYALNYLRQNFWPKDIDRDTFPRLQAHTQPLDPASAESLDKPIA
jgi:hypothetical protein